MLMPAGVQNPRQGGHYTNCRPKGFIDIKGNVQILENGSHRQTCSRYCLLDRGEWQLSQ